MDETDLSKIIMVTKLILELNKLLSLEDNSKAIDCLLKQPSIVIIKK
jgi:hypothetical protein